MGSCRFIVSGQIPRVDYFTFLDYFVYFCFFAQFTTLFSSQVTANVEKFYGWGSQANMWFMFFQLLCGSVCFEWMYTKLHNHFIDVRQWVGACDAENQTNLLLSQGKPIDHIAVNTALLNEAAAKARRRSFFDILIRNADHHSQGTFTSFGAASVVGAMLNQSKQMELDKAKIDSSKQSTKVSDVLCMSILR
jgi:hypothetical protein